MKEGFVLKHKSSDKAVILFHGLTGSPFEMVYLARKLFKEGFDIYCPILPGHCAGLEEIRKVVWQDWYNFSLNKFDEIKASYNEVYLGGICLGAVLALAVASVRSEATAISALSTTLFLDGWNLPWYKILFPIGLYTILKFFYVFPESEPYGIKNLETRKKVAGMLGDNEAALECYPMSCVLELIKLSSFVRKSIKKIQAPLLIMHSIEDDLSSIKSSDFIYKHSKSIQKDYKKLKNSYHLIVLDNEKDIVAEETINFFKNYSSLNSQSA